MESKSTSCSSMSSARRPGGYALCGEVRSHYHTPIVFLSEEHSVVQRVQALKLGADDVLQKPFNPTELLVRIEAIMRRYGDGDLRVHVAYHPSPSAR